MVQGANTAASYTYDPVGNRLSSLIGQYSFNNSNELTAVGANSYSYDDNGNMLSKTTAAGTSTYTWDFEIQLSSRLAGSPLSGLIGALQKVVGSIGGISLTSSAA